MDSDPGFGGILVDRALTDQIPESTKPREMGKIERRFYWIFHPGWSLRRLTGRIIHALYFPAFLPRQWDFDDLVTKQKIHIRTSTRFTVLSINGRDYYFYRESGKFDGTGMAVCQ